MLDRSLPIYLSPISFMEGWMMDRYCEKSGCVHAVGSDAREMIVDLLLGKLEKEKLIFSKRIIHTVVQ